MHEWLARYANEGGLADRSSRPGSCPHQMPVVIEAQIVGIGRAHPGWGPSRILFELERTGAEPLPGRSAVYRALMRPNLVEGKRRRLLKLIGFASTTGFAVLSDERLRRSTAPTPEMVKGLDQLADKYQALYHSTAPAALMTPVVAHLETVRDLLRQGGINPLLRRKLFANRARVATLAGRDMRSLPPPAVGYAPLSSRQPPGSGW